jgi:methyl-accepting chemotaxis protein
MKKIRNKILLILLSASSFFTILIGAYSLFTIASLNDQEISEIRSTLTDDYDIMIQNEVDAAVTLVGYFYDSYTAGTMTEVKAKEAAIAAVKTLRYNEEGYFWIDDTEGILIAHPIQPENEGTNRIDIEDPNGVKLIQEIISAATANKNSGFTDFMWVKPADADTGKSSPKRAYSKLFEPWNWIISTGNYIDDIDRTISLKEQELNDNFKRNAISILGFILLSLIGIGILGILLSGIISRPIVRLVKSFEKDENGRITIQEIKNSSRDEIGLLALTLNEMSAQVKEFILGVLQESQNVAASADLVRKDMMLLNNEVQEISSATEEIAAGMEETTAISEDMKNKAQDLSYSAESIAEQAKEASGAVNEISRRAAELKSNLSSTVKSGTVFIRDAEQRLSQALEDSRAVAQISELANVIIEIANQTNLLALNAAIEAARAGDAGKGFAVVAEEIRKLADTSQSTISQIQDMIKSVTLSMDSLYSNSNDLVKFLSQNVRNDYNIMLDTSDEYNKDAEYLNTVISDFRDKAVNLSLVIQSMTKAMNEIASATYEGAEGTGSIVNSVDLVNEKANGLLARANESEQYSQALLQMVSRFKV